MPANHEVGLWFEINRRLCVDAGIPWRGNPQWEWDYHVPVAYAIGYPDTMEPAWPSGQSPAVVRNFANAGLPSDCRVATPSRLGLIFEWSGTQSAFQNVRANTLRYRFRDFDYAVPVLGATATQVENDVRIIATDRRGFAYTRRS